MGFALQSSQITTRRGSVSALVADALGIGGGGAIALVDSPGEPLGAGDVAAACMRGAADTCGTGAGTGAGEVHPIKPQAIKAVIRCMVFSREGVLDCIVNASSCHSLTFESIDSAHYVASHRSLEVDSVKRFFVFALINVATISILSVQLFGCSSSNGGVGDGGRGGAGSGGVAGSGGDTAASSSSSGDLFDGGFFPNDDAGPPDAMKPPVENLVPNGDFEAGNTQFSSDYTYATLNTVEGEYTVGTNPRAFNGNLLMIGDHTTGAGMMFIGNGKATPDRVWYAAPIAVQPNTKYYFEAWVMNACCPPPYGDGVNPVGPSELSFYANDQLLGTRTSSKLGVWEGLSTTWNSGSDTSVTLKLVNANTQPSGNDFGVDDVFLGIETSIPPPP